MGKTKKHEKKSKKKHKHKDRKEKKKSKKLKKDKQPKDEKSKKDATTTAAKADEDELDDNFAIPVELMNKKSHAPETPEEYQKRQKEIRRVTDPVTGRTRLIKGDGEVLEEIVSRERHADINKSATLSDGRFFQENTIGATTRQRPK